MSEIDLFEKSCIICGSSDAVNSIFMKSKNEHVYLCKEHFLVHQRLCELHG